MNWWKSQLSSIYAPYHVTTVLEKVGTTILCIEADAADISRKRPIFDVYK